MTKQPLDHLRSRKKPVWKKIPICLDSEQADKAQQARAHALMMRTRYDQRTAGRAVATPEDQRLLQEVEDAEAEADRLNAEVLENSAWFMVRSLGPRRFEELQSAHPPTKDQREQARKEGVQGVLGWNPDTFPIAIIAACCYFIHKDEDTGEEFEEQLTEEFVKEMYEGDQWNMAECNALLQAAIDTNQTRRVADQGNVFGQTRHS